MNGRRPGYLQVSRAPPVCVTAVGRHYLCRRTDLACSPEGLDRGRARPRGQAGRPSDFRHGETLERPGVVPVQGRCPSARGRVGAAEDEQEPPATAGGSVLPTGRLRCACPRGTPGTRDTGNRPATRPLCRARWTDPVPPSAPRPTPPRTRATGVGAPSQPAPSHRPRPAPRATARRRPTPPAAGPLGPPTTPHEQPPSRRGTRRCELPGTPRMSSRRATGSPCRARRRLRALRAADSGRRRRGRPPSSTVPMPSASPSPPTPAPWAG
ncbi:hypothetical protein MIFL109517_01185 [Micrococcus flavus]